MKEKFYVDILKQKNSIFVGVRLGYYLDKKNWKIFGRINKKYYLKAMDVIKASILNPTFVFFSNDIEAARDEFGNIKNVFNVNLIYV